MWVKAVKREFGQVFVKHRCFSLCSTRNGDLFVLCKTPSTILSSIPHKPKSPKSEPKQPRSGKQKLLPSPDPHNFRAMFPFPGLSDTKTMLSILRLLGAKIEFNERNKEILVNTDGVGRAEPCLGEMRKIRGGFFVIGPLLARFGEAVVGLPGGCDIGERPVDFVGATETLMMAASMADGVTVLSNAAKEPEVTDLARFLNDSGACVYGAGSDKLLIKGKCQLRGCECNMPPDRIEAGTFLLAAAITRSLISISPVTPSHLSCLIDKLKIAGCKITRGNNDTLEVSAIPENVCENLRGFNVRTSPFPGFPTDLQPPTMALLTTCSGSSIVEESVFDRRLGHVRELQKLGAKIQVCGSTALVFGRETRRNTAFHSVILDFMIFIKSNLILLIPLNSIISALHGSRLRAADLGAEGTTEISDIGHIGRGYENLDTKLQFLGADIKRSIPMASQL
ncbi:EPSP synthase domain-containing protein [Citrus sinensis]|nr:EPSP synthase domain-containing protein [Citrus sinensis]